MAYGNWRAYMADNTVRSDIESGTSSLMSYRNFKNGFPPNMAGTNFSASQGVALSLFTNAPSVGVYDSLTDHQNAQLMLNVCNGNLGDTNNTACVFNGNGGGAKIHVKGTEASNVHWRSPIKESDIVLTGSDPSIAQGIIDQFKAQGGVFPIIVSSSDNATMPEPDQIPNGLATRFCLESESAAFDIVYHTVDGKTGPVAGPCPEDPELKYFPI